MVVRRQILRLSSHCFALYMIEHPTFQSAQDDEMRREV